LRPARRLVPPHARGRDHLPHEQVDFLEVAAGLRFLGDQQVQPALERILNLGDRWRVVPFFSILSCLHGRALEPQFVRDLRDAPAPPQYRLRACRRALTGIGMVNAGRRSSIGVIAPNSTTGIAIRKRAAM